MAEMYRMLREKKGSQNDFDLADQIINFVFKKKSLGATGPQIKV